MMFCCRVYSGFIGFTVEVWCVFVFFFLMVVFAIGFCSGLIIGFRGCVCLFFGGDGYMHYLRVLLSLF